MESGKKYKVKAIMQVWGLYGPDDYLIRSHRVKSVAEGMAEELNAAYDAGRASALSEREGEVRRLREALLVVANTAATIEYARTVASEALALTNGGAA